MAEHFNRLTPEEDELLACLAEEASEVIKVICKIQRHGIHSLHPTTGVSNYDQLQQELGDFKAIQTLLANIHVVNVTRVKDASSNKLSRIGQWLHHYKIATLVGRL